MNRFGLVPSPYHRFKKYPPWNEDIEVCNQEEAKKKDFESWEAKAEYYEDKIEELAVDFECSDKIEKEKLDKIHLDRREWREQNPSLTPVKGPISNKLLSHENFSPRENRKHGDLFQLPAEVRLRIYKMVFRQDGYIRTGGKTPCDKNDAPCGYPEFCETAISTRSGRPSKYHHLLLTSKYIHLEALSVYRAVNKFLFYCTCRLWRWYSRTPFRAFQKLRWVCLILEGTMRAEAIQALARIDKLEVLHLVITDQSMEFELIDPRAVANLQCIKGVEWAHVEVMKNLFDKTEDRRYVERMAQGLESMLYDCCVEKANVSNSCATSSSSADNEQFKPANIHPWIERPKKEEGAWDATPSSTSEETGYDRDNENWDGVWDTHSSEEENSSSEEEEVESPPEWTIPKGMTIDEYCNPVFGQRVIGRMDFSEGSGESSEDEAPATPCPPPRTSPLARNSSPHTPFVS